MPLTQNLIRNVKVPRLREPSFGRLKANMFSHLAEPNYRLIAPTHAHLTKPLCVKWVCSVDVWARLDEPAQNAAIGRSVDVRVRE